MKYKVDQNCIGCGLCFATCPAVFTMTDENVAQAILEDVRDDWEALCNEALSNCPVGAISRD